MANVHEGPPSGAAPTILGVKVKVPGVCGVPLPVKVTHCDPAFVKVPVKENSIPLAVLVAMVKLPGLVTYTFTSTVLVADNATPVL